MPDYHEFDWQMSDIESITRGAFPLTAVNVRKTPFLDAGIIANVAAFDPTRVSRKLYPSDGHDWYKIENAETSAFVSSKAVTIIPVKETSPETRYIIDLLPDTIIVSESELPIVQEVFSAFCRNLLNRVNNPKRYEEGD